MCALSPECPLSVKWRGSIAVVLSAVGDQFRRFAKVRVCHGLELPSVAMSEKQEKLSPGRSDQRKF